MRVIPSGSIFTEIFSRHNQKPGNHISVINTSLQRGSLGRAVVRGTESLTLFHLPRNIWEWIVNLFKRNQVEIADLQDKIKSDKKKFKKKVEQLKTENNRLNGIANQLMPQAYHSNIQMQQMREQIQRLEQEKTAWKSTRESNVNEDEGEEELGDTSGGDMSSMFLNGRPSALNLSEIGATPGATPYSSPMGDVKNSRSVERRKRFSEAAGQYHQQRAELEVRKKELEQREAEMRAANEVMPLLREKAAKVEETLEMLGNAQRKIDQLTKESETTTQGYTQIIRDLTANFKEATEKVKKVDQLEQEVRRLEEMSRQAQETGQKDSEDLFKKNEELQIHIEQLNAEKEELEAANKDKKKSIDKLNDENNELFKGIEEFNEQVTKLKNENNELAARNETLNQTILAHKTTYEEKDDQITELQNQLEGLKTNPLNKSFSRIETSVGNVSIQTEESDDDEEEEEESVDTSKDLNASGAGDISQINMTEDVEVPGGGASNAGRTSFANESFPITLPEDISRNEDDEDIESDHILADVSVDESQADTEKPNNNDRAVDVTDRVTAGKRADDTNEENIAEGT